MEFIPYQRLTITTHLTKAEVVARMKERVGPMMRENFVRIDKHIFSGRLVNDKFELTLNKDYRNSWTPQVTGTISEREGGVELRVTLRSNSFVIVLTAGFVLFGLALLIDEIVNFKSFKDFDWSEPLFALFPYGLCWFGFNLDADQAIDGLIKNNKR